MTLSMAFKTIGTCYRSHAQAVFTTAIIVLIFMMYAGFVIPPMYMVSWFQWITYINPVAYTYESLIINEFSGRIFPCANLVPTGPSYIGTSSHNRVCSVVGSIAGFEDVLGTIYLELRFGFQPNHLWRNMSILFAFMALFMSAYLATISRISTEKLNGEILLFQRGHKPQPKRQRHLEIYSGAEIRRYGNGDPINKLHRQTSTFQWKDICLDIKTVDGTCRILDHVDGWVKPGTLTALMGPSGAGKTSLLDVLASRTSIGIVSGESFVDGCIKDISFQRKVGYVQQHDFHLPTMTVREALQFSAIMRLNIEQRKKLSMGIELAAKPKLLLFLDEPTSGLDSSTSWEIVELLKKITAHGQAVLCTIHQPSMALFQRFDRLLFLAPGGRTVYFGRIGENCETVKKYFEANGARPCPADENVAEWIMQTLASSFVPQLLPNFLVQRAVFEARESPAKMYSWPAFIISNILVEVSWNTFLAIIIFLSWYYPVGMYRNALITKTMLERNGVMLLLIWVYLIYASTFGYMVQVGLELTGTAGNLSNAAFLSSLMFCGIFSVPTALPQVWDIVRRLSPFTYLVDGMLSVGLANVPVKCSQNEFLHFEPVTGSSCGSYMASYLHQAGGYLTNPSAKSRCVYCPLKDSNGFLARAGMSYTNRWRNFCIMWAYSPEELEGQTKASCGVFTWFER
ncbi:hypothetical protein SS1G_13498 [Sclerotinia sclerotiorum 1980 UF-70]|uniref:ABC transporter domain-containing protein n=1 Tax=Sclerotinia sclerotiorum (strain ATCC 18683 / 1980 / Ss-1) TaxID=665079 RepID=A7F7B8_SCLS1|nr:hypothetical protein SS1G_13498 [Sclerotinia sclerotiorum 1980 UF-70]EDN98639.1 hypothetical protein SS1G_13498 [Sclerotinia sclerotiorum 1980 UF-70]